jgi:hypothetical protein
MPPWPPVHASGLRLAALRVRVSLPVLRILCVLCGCVGMCVFVLCVDGVPAALLAPLKHQLLGPPIWPEGSPLPSSPPDPFGFGGRGFHLAVVILAGGVQAGAGIVTWVAGSFRAFWQAAQARGLFAS